MSATHDTIKIKGKSHEVRVIESDGSWRPIIDIQADVEELVREAYGEPKNDNELYSQLERAERLTAQIA